MKLKKEKEARAHHSTCEVLKRRAREEYAVREQWLLEERTYNIGTTQSP